MAGMAGEKDDLFFSREPTKQLRRGFLPDRIEIDHGIVEEDETVSILEKPTGHGEAHGEPETGTSAGREHREGHGRSIRPRRRRLVGERPRTDPR